MKRHLKLLAGLLVLAGCRQVITIPDQDFLILMNGLDHCWNDNTAVYQCTCAVEKVREDYPHNSDLDAALKDPATRAQAKARIETAITSCNAAKK